MECNHEILPATVLHWNYRGFTEFPMRLLSGEETDITDIYLKENLISQIPTDIGRLENLESLYLSGNDITCLPREISKLRSLKCLDVSGNRLRSIPDDIGELRRLKFLILDENELRDLPLRLGELRSLRYLSVCDNNLEWLPQRPVYNYHHCEFRFWRNQAIRSLPYSLWFHMFKEQQTRSLNIGCLKLPKDNKDSQGIKIKLKPNRTSTQDGYIEIKCPSQYINILGSLKTNPPSLYELSKRIFYQMLIETAKKLNEKQENILSPSCWGDYYNDCTNKLNNIQNILGGCNIRDMNGNITADNQNNNLRNGEHNNRNLIISKNKINYEKLKMKPYYVPSDIIESYFDFLPNSIKSDLCNGPLSRCENIYCKKPVFDYVTFEFCFGKVILIDNTEDVLLTAAFCSKSCADFWKQGKNIISWCLA